MGLDQVSRSKLGLFHYDFELSLQGGILKNLLLFTAFEHFDFGLLAPGLALPDVWVGAPFPLPVLHPGTCIGQVVDREAALGMRHFSHFSFALGQGR